MNPEPEPETRALVRGLPGARTWSPDPLRVRERRAELTGLRLKWFEYRVVPADVPDQFTMPLADLRDQLAVDDPDTAENVLAEAQAFFDETSERIESAERRATSLQSTVAIAASLVVAGAGLLLDQDKIADDYWRAGLVFVLGMFLFCLVTCAWRALAVTGRMFEFDQPGTERIVERASLARSDAVVFRAAELLRAGAVASEVGAIKVGLLREAAKWLRRALAILGLFVVLLFTYVVLNDDAGSTPTSPPVAGAHAHTTNSQP